MNQYALDGKMWWAGLYSTEVGKVRESLGLTPAYLSDMATTPQGVHNLRRQGILESLQFLRSKFI